MSLFPQLTIRRAAMVYGFVDFFLLEMLIFDAQIRLGIPGNNIEKTFAFQVSQLVTGEKVLESVGICLKIGTFNFCILKRLSFSAKLAMLFNCAWGRFRIEDSEAESAHVIYTIFSTSFSVG